MWETKSVGVREWNLAAKSQTTNPKHLFLRKIARRYGSKLISLNHHKLFKKNSFTSSGRMMTYLSRWKFSKFGSLNESVGEIGLEALCAMPQTHHATPALCVMPV